MNSFNKPSFAKLLKKDDHLFRLILVLIVVFIVCSVIQPTLFLKGENFISMAKQFPEYGLLAIGMSLALLIGGIDLSVVNIANLSVILSAVFLRAAVPADMPAENTLGYILIAFLICLATGIVAGMINGLLISKLGIPAILATLGTSQLFMGGAIVITSGKAISGFPELLSAIINASLWDIIPVVLLIFIVFAIVVSFLLTKTKTGARLYLLGTNPKASQYAGINNDRLIIFTYTAIGFLSAVAGIIMMGRSNSVKPDYGLSYTMQCILIAVLGGVNPTGGKGNIHSVVVSIIILQFLSSFMNMFENISNFYREVLWGGLLILVLISNYFLDKRYAHKRTLSPKNTPIKGSE